MLQPSRSRQAAARASRSVLGLAQERRLRRQSRPPRSWLAHACAFSLGTEALDRSWGDKRPVAKAPPPAAPAAACGYWLAGAAPTQRARTFGHRPSGHGPSDTGPADFGGQRAGVEPDPPRGGPGWAAAEGPQPRGPASSARCRPAVSGAASRAVPPAPAPPLHRRWWGTANPAPCPRGAESPASHRGHVPPRAPP